MQESINVYAGDGSTLPTPELNQKLWPIEYDAALNIFVTKDINGIITPVGAGGTPPITMTVKIALSSSEILTLGTVPIVALPAVTNKAYLVHLATLETTNAPGTGYGGGKTVILVTETIIPPDEQTKFKDILESVIDTAVIGEIVKGKKDEVQYLVNKSLLITTDNGADPTGGNMDYLITIFYSLI